MCDLLLLNQLLYNFTFSWHKDVTPPSPQYSVGSASLLAGLTLPLTASSGTVHRVQERKYEMFKRKKKDSIKWGRCEYGSVRFVIDEAVRRQI